MENASKALIMAGGILIAILILTILVYVGANARRLAKAEDEAKLASQTAEFNRQYESYKDKLLYGTDVLTVYNKADDYNKRFNLKGTADEIEVNITEGIEYVKENKTKIFTCTGIEYNQISGRVKTIYFEEYNGF